MKYLIFDMDGTLIDSMPAWACAEREMLEHFAIDRKKVADIDKLEQMTFAEVAKLLINHTSITNKTSEIIDYMNMQTDYFYKTKSSLKLAAKDFLTFLKGKGVKMSLASSTDNIKAVAALKQFGIYDFFDYIFTNDILFANKSQRKFWQEVSNKTQTPTNEMILFDDALYALTGAKQSGLFTVGLRDHQDDKKFNEIRQISDLAINDIKDLNFENFYHKYILNSK